MRAQERVTWAEAQPAAPVLEAGSPEQVKLRGALPRDVDAVHTLIERHQEAGHLLPRTRDEIAAHIGQFVVATRDEVVVGCAEMAPIGRDLAEVRSLVVSDDLQGFGVGRALVAALVESAVPRGLKRVCAFTHAPGFFVRLGFSIVPHLSLPEKVFTDCVRCPLFRRCGQQAVVLALAESAAMSVQRRVS